MMPNENVTIVESPAGTDDTRRNVVIRALEFAAHGHGELPAGFMSDAVDCLTGVLRGTEEAAFAAGQAAQLADDKGLDDALRAGLVAMDRLEAVRPHLDWLDAQAEFFRQNPQVHSTFKECAARLRTAVNAPLEAAGQASRRDDGWIAVAERMPPSGDDVLVFSGLVREFGIAGFRDGLWKEDLSGLILNKGGLDVTHWMPLPPAPEREDG